ncbi:hypothetical protein [Streptomyces sp. NPDC005760]|uniref:hypothetical protein n=1 Tax=Streptomyces sp. NPDC005760 TaxID=3156718 RepID=UPI0033E12ACE
MLRVEAAARPPIRVDRPCNGGGGDHRTDWAADKIRYRLAVDPAENTALTGTLNRCPNELITVTFAR